MYRTSAPKPPPQSALTSVFSPLTFRCVRKDSSVLDLGAGDGTFAQYLAELRKTNMYTGVDILPRPNDLPANAVWHTESIEQWCEWSCEVYDLVYVRNVLQFLDRAYTLEHLLPDLLRRVEPGGHIALSTFTAPPVPSVDLGWKSLYSLRDFSGLFTQWKTVLATQEPYFGRTRQDPTMRTWHTVQLIMERPLHGKTSTSL